MPIFKLCIIVFLGWLNILRWYAQNTPVYPLQDAQLYRDIKPFFIQQLIKGLNAYSQNNDIKLKKKYLIRNFCDAMLQDLPGQWFQHDETLIIDPKQSVFLYHLCLGVDKTKYENFFPKLQDLIIYNDGWDTVLRLKNQTETIIPFNQEQNIRCSSTQPNLGDCKIHVVTTPLIYAILDDIYRLKYATIQLYQWPEIKAEDFTRSYARRFFTHDLSQISQGGFCNQQFYHYLYPQELEDQKSRFCSHPKTFRELEILAQTAGSRLRQNRVIQGNKAEMYLTDTYSNDVGDSEYAKYCNIYTYPDRKMSTRKRNLDYHILKCAWIINHDDANIGLDEYQKAQWSMQAFYNLEYNELLMYRLFILYYELIAQYDNQYANSTPQIAWLYQQTDNQVSDELDQLREDRSYLQKLQEDRHKSLGDFAMAFHLRVSHRIYQEDLSVFQKQYGIVITQISQLRNKLYQAQKVEK